MDLRFVEMKKAMSVLCRPTTDSAMGLGLETQLNWLAACLLSLRLAALVQQLEIAVKAPVRQASAVLKLGDEVPH